MIISISTIKIQENIPLKNYSTFKIGGPTRYFTLVHNKSQLIEALQWSKKKNSPFLILGNCSKILFSDKGYKGLVIKIQISDINIEGDRIICGAGLPISKALRVANSEGLAGLEWAAGIPGTIGGAIFGNAGAFDWEMKDIVENVKALNFKNLKIENFKNKDCQFSYRSSLFKKKKHYIIIEAKLKFKKKRQEDISGKIKKNLLYRKEKQPLEYPSVGSIFKNVKLTKENLKLIQKFPDLKQFFKRGEIPVAYLIHNCNLKGKRIGDAQISEKHPNFIININNSTSKDVKGLIRLTKQKIKQKFKIKLEEEVIIL